MLNNRVDPYERRFLEKGVVARHTGSIGWGLFAETTFVPGEPIFWLDLEDKSRSMMVPFQDAFGDCYERSVTVVPDFTFCCLSEHPFWNVNHTCDGNSGFVNWGRIENGKIPFVAHREIRPGEQISSDYSLMTAAYDGTPEGGPWDMACMCDLPDCRGTVVGFNLLPQSLQLGAILPPEGPQGRVIAHILEDEPHLVEMLKPHPLQYRQYLDVLRQQWDISAYFHKVMG